MCVWLRKEKYTACGCTVERTDPKPTCQCGNIVEQGCQDWDGTCNRSQCPNPGK